MKAGTKCYRCDELFSRESDYRTLCDNCMHDTEELLESIGRPPDDEIKLVGKVDGWILRTKNLENARWYISELRHNLVPGYAWEVQGKYYILIGKFDDTDKLSGLSLAEGLLIVTMQKMGVLLANDEKLKLMALPDTDRHRAISKALTKKILGHTERCQVLVTMVEDGEMVVFADGLHKAGLPKEDVLTKVMEHFFIAPGSPIIDALVRNICYDPAALGRVESGVAATEARANAKGATIETQFDEELWKPIGII
jgi:hypothetical protein